MGRAKPTKGHKGVPWSRSRCTHIHARANPREIHPEESLDKKKRAHACSSLSLSLCVVCMCAPVTEDDLMTARAGGEKDTDASHVSPSASAPGLPQPLLARKKKDCSPPTVQTHHHGVYRRGLPIDKATANEHGSCSFFCFRQPLSRVTLLQRRRQTTKEEDAAVPAVTQTRHTHRHGHVYTPYGTRRGRGGGGGRQFYFCEHLSLFIHTHAHAPHPFHKRDTPHFVRYPRMPWMRR